MNRSAVRTLSAVLSAQASAHARKPFVTYGGRTWAYGEFDETVSRAAVGLMQAGIVKGDRVAIALPNCVEFLIAWFAICRVGALEVPIGLEQRSLQVAYMLSDSAASILICKAEYYRAHKQVIDASPVARLLICGDMPAEAVRPAATRFGDFLNAPSIASFPDVQPYDPFAIMYTSGTTGDPKGVVLCHEQELTLADNIARSIALTDQDCFYNFFPLNHNTGQGIITGSVLVAGARMLLVDRFSRTSFWRDVCSNNCTTFYGIGPIIEVLNKDADAVAEGHHLRVAWGIAIGVDQAARFRERFGVGFVTGYGSTEMNMVAISDAATPPDAAGRVADDFEVAIVDEHDTLLPYGSVGEIVVRPRRAFVTSLGYWRKEQQTLEAWRNLWVHTGDAGTLSADGVLRFVDRMRDVIRRRGHNISSVEVEKVILALSEVEEVAVLPAPSDLGAFDEEVRAIIVPRAGMTIDPPRIVQACAENLPHFAVPRFVDVVDELPKTATGKVRKAELKKRPPTAAQWDRQAMELAAVRSGKGGGRS